jgi:hypothetical protein
VERLNDLNRYLLFFPEENLKQLDQDEIVENIDEAKAPEIHKVMVNANIDILKCILKNLCLISSVWNNGTGPASIPVFNTSIFICYQ